MTNSPIQGRDGAKYDALGKGTAVAKCLEDQFKPNDPNYRLQDHNKQVRRGVQLFHNTSFVSSIKPVSGNEVRKIIKHLKSNKALGYVGVTYSMTKLPCHFVNHLVAIFKQCTEVASLSS